MLKLRFWSPAELCFLAVFAVTVAFVAACGNLPEAEIPTAPDGAPVGQLPPPPPPDQTGIGGGPTPTPTPASGPTPTPPPPPTPTPSPASPPAASSCRLPAQPECGGPESAPGVFGCCTEATSSTFAAQVERAQEVVGNTRPDLFSGGRIVDDHAYATAVAEELRRVGLCATPGGPEDEVGVKNSNDFSEQYDIVLGSTQTPWTNHTVTCRPARF